LPEVAAPDFRRDHGRLPAPVGGVRESSFGDSNRHAGATSAHQELRARSGPGADRAEEGLHPFIIEPALRTSERAAAGPDGTAEKPCPDEELGRGGGIL